MEVDQRVKIIKVNIVKKSIKIKNQNQNLHQNLHQNHLIQEKEIEIKIIEIHQMILILQKNIKKKN